LHYQAWFRILSNVLCCLLAFILFSSYFSSKLVLQYYTLNRLLHYAYGYDGHLADVVLLLLFASICRPSPRAVVVVAAATVAAVVVAASAAVAAVAAATTVAVAVSFT
jgi:hypothetical protein